MTPVEQKLAYLLVKLLTLETHMITESDNPSAEAENIRCTGEAVFWSRNQGASLGTGSSGGAVRVPSTAYWQLPFGDTYQARALLTDVFATGGLYYGTNDIGSAMSILSATGYTVYATNLDWRCDMAPTPITGPHGPH